MTDEVELTGGGTTHVVRAGDTVRRPTQAWTPAVHGLLAHLRENGFEGAPRALGSDDRQREILDFVPGEVGNYPLSEEVRSVGALVSAGRLLREYHDATVGFASEHHADAPAFQLEPLLPVEVVCHSDFAPYNVVFREGQAVAIIDFDYARLGPRSWDLAYALYRFAPLTVSFGPGDELSRLDVQKTRARMFLDAYGCDREARRDAMAAVVPRLEALVALMRASAVGGDDAFAGHIEDGHDAIYLNDIEYVSSNSENWRSVID